MEVTYLTLVTVCHTVSIHYRQGHWIYNGNSKVKSQPLSSYPIFATGAVSQPFTEAVQVNQGILGAVASYLSILESKQPRAPSTGQDSQG